MSVVLGQYEKQYFDQVVDSAGTSYGATVCGDRTFEIYSASDNTLSHVMYVDVSDDAGQGEFMIVAFSEDENDEGYGTFYIRTTFTDYPLTEDPNFPKSETTFGLEITQAVCDCSLITWDQPDLLYLTTELMKDPADTLTFVKATANEDSKSASPAIRACYRNNASCSEDSTLTIVDDATQLLDGTDDFMVMVGLVMTVTPTISSHIGVYQMLATQNPSIRTEFSWIAAEITVTCTITEITVPDLPTASEYIIGSDTALVIDLSPPFEQYPPCGYPLSETMLWTFEPSSAPAVPTFDNLY